MRIHKFKLKYLLNYSLQTKLNKEKGITQTQPTTLKEDAVFVKHEKNHFP